MPLFLNVKLWLKISRSVSIFGYIFTLFFNMVLIILTGWYIKRKFGTYKYLIIMFSAIGIIFDSLDFIVMPMLHSYDKGFVYFTTLEPNFLSKDTLTHLLCIYGDSFYVSISFLAIMFIHRYFSVAKPEQLFFFQEKRMIFWISYSLIVGYSSYFSNMFFCKMDDYSTKYMKDALFETYNIILVETPAIGMVLYDDISNIRWLNGLHIIVCSSLMLFQNMIIVFCGYKIRQKIYSKNISYSKSLRRLHSQFFKTLIFQIATPIVLLFIPLAIILYLPLTGIEVNFPTGILFGLFGLYPAIDSCLVMYIITDYKTAMRDFINDVRMYIYGDKQKKYEVKKNQNSENPTMSRHGSQHL